LQKLDAFKEKSLAITRPATSFNEVTYYQRDLYNMFLTDDVLIEAGIKKGNEKNITHLVYRADELGGWLRSLARTQDRSLQSINYEQIEIYWITGIEKVDQRTFKVHAWAIPWDRVAYREGDITQMPGVKEVERELSRSRIEEIMASGEEIFIAYLKMALQDRPAGNFTNPNARTGENAGQTIHTVQPGETLFSIAMKHDVEIGDIMADNNMSSTTIQRGQNLVINKVQHTASPSTDSRLPDYLNEGDGSSSSSNQRTREDREERIALRPVYYTVRRDENGRSIARKFGLDFEQLMDWNPYAEFKSGEKVIVDMLAVE
jgi:LysM repeat protein